MIPEPDWTEPCLLTQVGGADREGPLADLVLIATRLDPADRPQYTLVSKALGELDNEQLEGLRKRPEFPGL